MSVGKKVLIAFHEEVPGGATLSVLRTLPYLQERGWKFVLWAPDPSDLASYLRDHGHVVFGAPRPIAYSLEAMRLGPGLAARARALPAYLGKFRAAVRKSGCGLVHANSLFTLAEASVARTAGLPVLLHVHEMRPEGRKGELGVRLAHRVASELVAVSTSCAAELSLGDRRPTVVHEGAPLPAQARSEPGGSVRVGTVGVVSTRKGSDLFVVAAERLAVTDPGIRFELVGAPTDVLEADWASSVLRRATDAGVEHSLRADVPERLSGWNIFALPSRRDPFPISMLEAMGHGLACVGTDIDGISEQLADGAGRLCRPDDPGSLAEAIAGLASDPGARSSLGQRARARVAGAFTVEHQAQALAAVYERLWRSRERSNAIS